MNNYESDAEDYNSTSSSEKDAKAEEAIYVDFETKVLQIDVVESEVKFIVERIKQITTLPGLKQSDWSDDVLEKLEKLVKCQHEKIIFLYYIGNELQTSFHVPNTENVPLTYFMKIQENISQQNFGDAFVFGTADNCMQEMIKILKTFYVPNLIRMKCNASSVKRKLIENLIRITSCLNEVYYKSFGFTNLFVPILKKEDRAFLEHHDMDFIFEEIGSMWCNAIQNVIMDIGESNGGYRSLTDEISFWKYRCENLNLLSIQMEDDALRSIEEYLIKNHSPAAENFKILRKRVLTEQEISENISKSLRIFDAPMENFKVVTSIENLIEMFPSLFCQLIAIYENATLFENRVRMERVILGLYKEVTNVCVEIIDINQIFQKEYDESIVQLKCSIQACLAFKHVYEQMINSLWVEETRQTVNKFQKRCEEILSICELVKIFDSFQGNDHSSNLINSIVTYKLQHELTGFKSTFFLMLCPIQEIVTEIFDVDSNKWIHVNDIFQYEFAALSIEMENALNESFSLVGNIEDALDALSFVNNYYNIPSLRQSFVNNVKNAREIFQEDMANAMLQNAVNSEYTENAVEILMKKQRMEVLHQRIQNCNYHDYETDEKYRLMIEYLNENIEYEFQKWTNEFESNIKRRFERPLIAKCFYKNGLYETNIDRKVLEMYKQRKIWIEIGVLIADEMDLWIGMEKYLIIYGHVQRIVMLYNKMIAGLTLSENELFQELIGKCEYAMKPGISVICWNSSESFKYAEWTSHYLNKMWKIIDNFKKRNLEMIEICELISNSHHHLLSLKQSWCKSLSNLKDNFEVQRLRVVRSVIQYYNEICKNLFHIRKTLTKYIPKVENVWKKYLEKWDNLVDRLLKMLIESVLTHAKNEFEADQLNRNVLITINVSIQNNRMAMSPSISEIMSFISNMLENLSRPLELVPRILSKFEYQSASQTYGQSILADIYIANIQTNIIYVTERMLEECKNWLLEWKKFRYVWKTSYNELKMNKDKEFIKTEISRNLEVIDTVNWMCEIEIRGMFLVNAEEVKLQIVNICKNNINQLSLLLQK